MPADYSTLAAYVAGAARGNKTLTKRLFEELGIDPQNIHGPGGAMLRAVQKGERQDAATAIELCKFHSEGFQGGTQSLLEFAIEKLKAESDQIGREKKLKRLEAIRRINPEKFDELTKDVP